jgi:hypothetical protein
MLDSNQVIYHPKASQTRKRCANQLDTWPSFVSTYKRECTNVCPVKKKYNPLLDEVES